MLGKAFSIFCIHILMLKKPDSLIQEISSQEHVKSKGQKYCAVHKEMSHLSTMSVYLIMSQSLSDQKVQISQNCTILSEVPTETLCCCFSKHNSQTLSSCFVIQLTLFINNNRNKRRIFPTTTFIIYLLAERNSAILKDTTEKSL